MTLTALYEWFAQDCTRAAGQTGDPKNREMLLKLAEQCSTHDGAPPKDRRCCRRRGARLSASVRDQGRCELKLAFAARYLASARATSAAQ